MKGYEKVKELLKNELDNYSFFIYDEIKLNNGYTQTEEDEYYTVDIKKSNDKERTLCFHYDKKEDILEVELGEDNFYEVATYDWKVKYFWMALLEW